MQPTATPKDHKPREIRFDIPSPPPGASSVSKSSNERTSNKNTPTKKTHNNKASNNKASNKTSPNSKPSTHKPSTKNTPPSANVIHGRLPLRIQPRPKVFVPFEELAAHTAKCDDCDHRNSEGMIRCLSCGWQCCRKCQTIRGGDKTHETVRCQHAPENEGSTLEAAGPSEMDTPLAAADDALTVDENVPTAADHGAAEVLMSLRSSPSTHTDSQFNAESPCVQSASANNDQLRNHIMDDYSDVGTVTGDSTITWRSDMEEGNEKLEPTLKNLDLLRRNPPRASRPTDMRD